MKYKINENTVIRENQSNEIHLIFFEGDERVFKISGFAAKLIKFIQKEAKTELEIIAYTKESLAPFTDEDFEATKTLITSLKDLNILIES